MSSMRRLGSKLQVREEFGCGMRGQGRAGLGREAIGLGVAAWGQCRLQPLEEPPSTHLRLPEFQLQLWLLLQAKEPLWLEGPL